MLEWTHAMRSGCRRSAASRHAHCKAAAGAPSSTISGASDGSSNAYRYKNCARHHRAEGRAAHMSHAPPDDVRQHGAGSCRLNTVRSRLKNTARSRLNSVRTRRRRSHERQGRARFGVVVSGAPRPSTWPRSAVRVLREGAEVRLGRDSGAGRCQDSCTWRPRTGPSGGPEESRQPERPRRALSADSQQLQGVPQVRSVLSALLATRPADSSHSAAFRRALRQRGQAPLRRLDDLVTAAITRRR